MILSSVLISAFALNYIAEASPISDGPQWIQSDSRLMIQPNRDTPEKKYFWTTQEMYELSQNCDIPFESIKTLAVRESLSLSHLPRSNKKCQASWAEFQAKFDRGGEIEKSVLTVKTKEEFLSALKQLDKITELTARYIKLEDEDVKMLAWALTMTENCALRSLDLSDNSFKEKGVEYLAGALKKNTSIQKLSLHWIGVRDAGAHYLADVLETNQHLIELNISNAHITKVGAEQLAKALKKNKVLKRLNVGSNEFVHHGAKFFAEALKENTVLEEFNFSGNNMDGYVTESTVPYFTDALKINKSLKILDLRYNRIVSVRAIAEIVKTNEHLEVLNLNGNFINDYGVDDLAKALWENRKIKFLKLVGNEISHELAEKYHAMDNRMIFWGRDD